MKYEFYQNTTTGVISVAYHPNLQGVKEVYHGLDMITDADYDNLVVTLTQTGVIPVSLKEQLIPSDNPEDVRLELEQGNGIKKILTVNVHDETADTIGKTLEPLTLLIKGYDNQADDGEDDLEVDSDVLMIGNGN